MAGKIIDFNKTVFEICRDDPEITEIMREIGFDQITNPISLATVGRFMTVPKGALMRSISMEKIREIFSAHGYDIIE